MQYMESHQFESIPWAAERGAHIVVRRPIPAVREVVASYKAEWKKLGRGEADLPLMGVNRHIVVADSDAAARDIARRGYPAWRHHMGLLWHEYNVPFPLEAALPPDFETILERGDAVAGTPDTVRNFITHEIEATGISYYVCDFAFGTVSHEDALRATELFAREVMPAFA